jgi:hypothetical protein
MTTRAVFQYPILAVETHGLMIPSCEDNPSSSAQRTNSRLNIAIDYVDYVNTIVSLAPAP